MNKQKNPFKDLRIFVLVPETVQTREEPDPDLDQTLEDMPVTTIHLTSGRLMAQSAHVVSKMRVENAKLFGSSPITTIVYSVRNSRELAKLYKALLDEAGVSAVPFYDEDPGYYRTTDQVLTAVCTTPVRRDRVEGVLDHLELAR